MDTSKHDFHTLFNQLGLPALPNEIETFIKTHKLLPDQSIEDAVFWSAAQAQFIREARNADADWAVLIDELDTLMRT